MMKFCHGRSLRVFAYICLTTGAACQQSPKSPGLKAAESAPASSSNSDNLRLSDDKAGPGVIAVLEPLTINFDQPFNLNGMKPYQIKGIQSVHKISRDISFFYAEDAQTWLYDRALDGKLSGSLTLLESALANQPGHRVYTLQNGTFWSIGPDSTLARSSPPDPNQTTVPTAQFKNTFQQEGQKDFKTVFADNFRIITTDSLRVSIVERNSDSSKFAQLDLMIPGGTADKPIYAAGLGASADQFWFARQGEIFFVELKDKTTWTWSKAPLTIQLKGSPLSELPISLAMAVKFDGNKRSVIGGAILQTASGFHANELVTPFFVEKDLRGIADRIVDPEFKAKCVPCHTDFASILGIRAKAGAIAEKLENLSMPPSNASPLGMEERGEILRWLRTSFME